MMRFGGFGLEPGSDALRRYHFDLEKGPEVIKDQEGVEASGLEVAITQAQTVIAEMRCGGELAELGVWTLVIRDTDGTVLTRLMVE